MSLFHDNSFQVKFLMSCEHLTIWQCAFLLESRQIQKYDCPQRKEENFLRNQDSRVATCDQKIKTDSRIHSFWFYGSWKKNPDQNE